MLKARSTARLHGGFPKLGGSLPVIGHMRGIHNDFLGMIRRGEREVGPAFWVNLGFGRQSLTLMQPEAFTLFKHKSVSSAHITEVKVLGELFGKSIIGQDGKPHHHARSAMTPGGFTLADMPPLALGTRPCRP